MSEQPCASTDATGIPEDTDDIASLSSKKAEKLFPESADEQKGKESRKEGVKDSSITGYRLVDMEILSSVFSSLRCTDCGSFSLTLTENQFKRSGCASCLRLFCENCGWRSEFHSSKKQTQSFEVNRRLVYTMRSLAKGHGGAKKFCTLMNMPPPSAANQDQEHNKKRRKVLRGKKKRKEDKNQSKEGVTYAAGQF